eukprot:TRINITY_DN377_c0_g2_i1.p3 TRINITY_DN377_c0_g2~~TRINITY_DN377_c0_g2_i1.p3  ORF type:complete len:203 (+),score=-0.19 TRINITY_DN377_c0_g2_i1:1005-1613(+)
MDSRDGKNQTFSSDIGRLLSQRKYIFNQYNLSFRIIRPSTFKFTLKIPVIVDIYQSSNILASCMVLVFRAQYKIRFKFISNTKINKNRKSVVGRSAQFNHSNNRQKTWKKAKFGRWSVQTKYSDLPSPSENVSLSASKSTQRVILEDDLEFVARRQHSLTDKIANNHKTDYIFVKLLRQQNFQIFFLNKIQDNSNLSYIKKN